MMHYEPIPDTVMSYIPDITKILQDEAIIFAYLFGGLARGFYTPLSDIDIAIYIDDVPDVADYTFNLFCKLVDAIKTSEIDIVVLNTAPESITGRIVLNKVILTDKEPLKRYIYESLTLRKYFDFKMKEEQILFRRYNIGRYTIDS